MPDEKKPPFPTVHGVEPRIATPKSVERPELPPTVKQRALDPTDPDIANQILNGIRDMNAGMKELRDSHAGIANEFLSLGTKVSSLIADVNDLKTWRQTGKHAPVVIGSEPRTTSGSNLQAVNEKIQTISGQNLDHAAAIGRLVADVTELKQSQSAQTAMLVSIGSSVKGFMKEHPSLSNAFVACVTAAIVLLTGWLQSKGH